MGKRILIGVGTFLMLVIGAVFVVPRVVDWNAYKGVIAEQVYAKTGRTMDIRGDVSVHLLPAPVVEIHDVRLHNIDGAHDGDMVRLSSLEVNIALFPLFHGEVRVHSVRLISPVIHLETMPDGRNNWHFAPVTASASSSSQGGRSSSGGSGPMPGNGEPALRLDNFIIENATLSYRRGAETYRIDKLNARMTAGSLKGPFDTAGDFIYRGTAIHYEASLGKIVAGRTLPVNFTIGLPGSGRLQASGAVIGLDGTPRFKGKVRISTQDAYATAHALLPAATIPSVLAQPFSLEGDVTASAQGIEAPSVALAMGATKGNLNLSVAHGTATTFKAALHADQVALDKWLALRPPPSASATTQTAPASPASSEASRVVALPNREAVPPAKAPMEISGTVEVGVDTIAYRGGIVSNTALQGDFDQGRFTLRRFSASLPGASALSVSGAVAMRGAPRFDGNLSLVVNDPHTLAAWFGVALPDGLRRQAHRVDLRGRLQAAPTEVTLSGVDMALDRTHIQGGVTVALRKRPAFGASVVIDRLDLDGILSAPSVSKRVDTSHETTGAAASTPGGGAASGGGLFEDMKAWTAMRVLKTFDANARAQVNALIYRGQTLRNVSFDGSLVQGVLTVHKAGIGDIAGAELKLGGEVSGFGALPQSKDLVLSLKASDGARLARMFGFADRLPAGIGAASINGRLDGALPAPSLAISGDVAGARFEADGKLSVVPLSALFDGTFRLVADDGLGVLRRLGSSYAPTGPLGKTDVRARVVLHKDSVSASQIQGRVGGVDVGGGVKLALSGTRPLVTGALSFGTVVVPRFLPPREVKKARLSLSRTLARLNRDNARRAFIPVATGGTPPPSTARAVDPRWSKTAVDLGILSALDADLQLTGTAVAFEKYRLDNPLAELSLKDGVLNVKKITGTFFGGPLDATASVQTSGTPTFAVTVSLKDADVRRAVRAVAGKDLATGTLSFDAKLHTEGRSPAQWVSALAGQGAIKLNRLDAKRAGSGSALSGIVGLLNAINALGGSAADKVADAGATFVIEQGLARTSDAVLTSGIGDARALGMVDLPRWRIDIEGKMAVKPTIVTALLSKRGVQKQDVPFSVKGRLDAPDVRVDTSALTGKTVLPPALDNVLKKKGIGKILQQLQSVPTQNAPTQNAPAPEAPSAPQNAPIKPQDVLRGILNGVLK